MIAFSENKPLWIKPILALLLWGVATASGGISTNYQVTIESRLAYHAFNPRDLASHRHTLNADQNFEFSKEWTASAGFRAYAEGAFASNPRFGESVRLRESYQLSLRDFYTQYRWRSGLLKVGNQQVVWGEAFGFYYADIVNPKDLREFGLGDLSAQRIPVTMVNAILFLKQNSSLQLIYIPKPFFNKNPALGGDFAPPFESFFPNREVSIEEPRSGALGLAIGEYGARFTGLIGGYDLAAFVFHYFDRRSTYRTSFAPNGDVTFQADHPRVSTVGFTATKDFPSFLARFESVYTTGRAFDTFGPNGYGRYTSDEITAALEIDFTQLYPWRVGAQISDAYIAKHQSNSLQQRHSPMISANVKGPAWQNHQVESVLSYSTNDGSSFAKLLYTIPTSAQFEVSVGAELFLGGQQSKYGSVRRASRGFVMLTGFLAK